MILTRQEFAHLFNALQDGLGDDSSPLWAGEDCILPRSNWFICVKPLSVHRFKKEYWDWCNATLKGRVGCYSSNREDQKEWWGFTDREDIVLWTLKWT